MRWLCTLISSKPTYAYCFDVVHVFEFVSMYLNVQGIFIKPKIANSYYARIDQISVSLNVLNFNSYFDCGTQLL